MDQQSAGAARRAPRSWLARRPLVLAALGAGLWLAGEATASAQELQPPLTASGPMTPAGGLAGSTVAPAVAPATAAVAPVVPAVAPVVHSATVPVADLTAPVVRSAEPVRAQVALLQDVVADAAEPLAGSLDLPPAPAVDALIAAPAAPSIRSQEPLDAGHHPTGGVRGGDGNLDRAAHRVVAAEAVVLPDAGPGGAAGGTVPVRPPAPMTGGPAPAWCTGGQSVDQSPADLAAAAEGTLTAALVAAGDARDAVGDHASDPCFSPD